MALSHAAVHERQGSPAFLEARRKGLVSLGVSDSPSIEGWDDAAKARLPFMAKHSLGAERAIDILCLVYGHSPDTRTPHEISLRRCTRIEDHLTRFAQRHEAPAEAIGAMKQGRASQIERCVATMIADPIQTGKTMHCIRFAKSPEALTACQK